MATFKLDGQDIPFEPGETIIAAAWRAGVEIPHYCWHPGLSIAANCRMCLVEVTSGRPMAMPILQWDDKKKEYVPATKNKLTPACQTHAGEGMEVSSQNDNVKKAQAAVQEFLLLNHPVDCPICDQAGECKLQDYYVEHQHTAKRKRTEPVHKPKGVRFGPTIVYDAERCIMCTRCIRVCDELVGDPVLDMRERGNKNEIVVSPGRELDHRYTLMTEHVCPVGALTSRDFRFKARVWFLKAAPTVCPGCATGCNAHADFDPRYGKVYRLRPRDNLDVNRFWMCDDGMMTYRRAQQDRILWGGVGRGEARDLVAPAEAVEEAATRLSAVDPKRLAVVLSAQHATEDNWVAARLARSLGVEKLYLSARPAWEGDDILRHTDQNPNRAGAVRAAGGSLEETVEDLVSDALAGEVDAALVLGAAAEEVEALAPLERLEVICLTSNAGPLADVASVLVPVASWLESHGTFDNAKGLSQAFKRAVPPPPDVEPAWQTLVRLAGRLGAGLDYAGLKEIRAEIEAARAAQTAHADGDDATDTEARA